MIRKHHQRKSITFNNNKKHDCDSLPFQVGNNWNDDGVYISSRKEEKKDHTTESSGGGFRNKRIILKTQKKLNTALVQLHWL